MKKEVINLEESIKSYSRAYRNLRSFDEILRDIFEARVNEYKLKDAEAMKEALRIEKIFKKLVVSSGNEDNYCFIKNGKEISFEEAMKYLRKSTLGACVDYNFDYGLFEHIVHKFIKFFEWVEEEEKEFIELMKD